MAVLRYIGTRGPGGICVDGRPIPSDMPIMVTPMNDQDVTYADNQAKAAKANAKRVRKEHRRRRREQKQRELSIAVATLTLTEIAADPRREPDVRIEASKTLLQRFGVG